jgi:hypothetical protein
MRKDWTKLNPCRNKRVVPNLVGNLTHSTESVPDTALPLPILSQFIQHRRSQVRLLWNYTSSMECSYYEWIHCIYMHSLDNSIFSQSSLHSSSSTTISKFLHCNLHLFNSTSVLGFCDDEENTLLFFWLIKFINELKKNDWVWMENGVCIYYIYNVQKESNFYLNVTVSWW